jgi:hypothetical protein
MHRGEAIAVSDSVSLKLSRCIALAAFVCVSLKAVELPPKPVRYDCGDATPDEQYVLQLINRARLDPKAEGVRLNTDLFESLLPAEKMRLEPRPPLAMNEKLLKTARAHSKDMYDRAYFEHTTPDGVKLPDRVKGAGYEYSTTAENIAAGSKHTPAELHDLLVIDSDTPDRGHRKNIFGLLKDTMNLREVGVGVYANEKKNSDGVSSLLTEDFGVQGVHAKPLLVGAVYADKNGNGFYDPGEGLAGVTIKSELGNVYAVTNSAGGWAIPVSPGRVKLTASGGDFDGTATASVRVTSDNVEIDFVSGKKEAVVNFEKSEAEKGKP